MSDSKSKIQKAAQILHQSRLSKTPITQLSKQGLSLTRSEAYEVQELGISLRKKAGEEVIGLKMGLTSEGKRKQMNLDSPLYGELTNVMQIPNGGHFSISSQIHSKIEPEIAFLINKDLFGEVSREDVLNSCEAVCAALEILDSRYEQFKYFSMEDVIADNSSSSHYILGPWEKNFKNTDLKKLRMNMKIDGQIVQTGLSEEISGDPVLSVVELCKLLALRDRSLKAGTFVLAGAATAAVELKPEQHVTLEVDNLPSIEVFIKG